MNTQDVKHRSLVDEETLVDRAHQVALIVEGLRHDPAWKDDGDTGRRRAAKHIGFVRYCCEVGEISDGDVGAEQ